MRDSHEEIEEPFLFIKLNVADDVVAMATVSGRRDGQEKTGRGMKIGPVRSPARACVESKEDGGRGWGVGGGGGGGDGRMGREEGRRGRI